MLKLIKITKFGFNGLSKYFSLICLISLILFNLNLGNKFQLQTIAVSQAEVQLQTKFSQRKNEIESQKQKLQDEILIASQLKQDKIAQSNSLATEIKNREEEIASLQKKIDQSNKVIQQIVLEQEFLKAKIVTTGEELGKIIVEIQKESRVPVIEKIFSSTIIDSFKRMYYLNSLNDEAAILVQNIETTQKELEKNRIDQEEVKAGLENLNYGVQAKKSSLEYLLEITKGEQAKYESEIRSSQEAQAEVNKQFEIENKAFQADVARVREVERIRAEQAAKEARERNNGGNNRPAVNYPTVPRDTGSGGCFFENKPPAGIPNGFFQMPARGVITGSFVCNGYNHDGLDIAAGMGTDLVSVANGVVADSASLNGCVGKFCNGGFGNFVVVEYTIPSGRNIYGMYAHMQYPTTLSIGEKVSKGQVVGKMGCTGNTLPVPCGVHLHFMFIDGTLSAGLSCIFTNAKCINPLRIIG